MIFKPIKLKGKRIILRKMEMKDAKQISKIANDFSVSRYTASMPYPYKLKDAEKWINHTRKKKDGYDLGIALRENDKIIGEVSINKIGESKKYKIGEIGYWLGKKYRGKGYAKEAAIILIDYLFNKFGLRKIYARVDGPNIGSQKFLENLGFKKEGVLREQVRYRFGNKWFDEFYYGLFKKEWKCQKSRISGHTKNQRFLLK
jgi:RimJ/RimL family protein N-acetyltransferase